VILKKRNIGLFLMLTLALLVLVTAGCSSATTTGQISGKAKILTIGGIDCLTGPASDQLAPAAVGERMAADYFNEQGGITINGQNYTIAVQQLDCQLDPQMSVTAAQSLISQGVKFIVGSFPDFAVRATASVTEPNGVLYVALNYSGGQDIFSTSTKYMFLGITCTVSQYENCVYYLKKIYPNVKTLAFAQADDGQTAFIQPAFKAMTQKYGITTLGDLIPWSNDIVDMSPIVQKLLMLKSDAIMMGNGGWSNAGIIIKQSREAGFTGPVVGLNTPIADIISVAGPKTTNISFGSLPDDVNLLPPIAKQLTKAWGKQAQNITVLTGFNAVYCLVQAMEKAQSLDPKVVADTWSKMTTIDTVFGPGQMGGKDVLGVNHEVISPQPECRGVDGKVVFGEWLTLGK
jgi:branched-chain amino acid transport system substrate-binding protein